MSVVEAVLDIIPDSVLQFTLSSQEATPTCILELRHPDPKAAPIAFKVKTTQPRRYLVRPNQGLITAGESQKVQILLVEKDKNSLLQSYQRLGQTALDHSKDKFLVQSVAILDEQLANDLSEYDKLTQLWSSVGSGSGGAASSSISEDATSAVANKKLHVRHVVAADTAGAGAEAAANSSSSKSAPSGAASSASRQPVESLSKDELRGELGTLRRKYDELVAFSVNLTAERDMLNNTLEQTKRDLNRLQVTKLQSAKDSDRNSTAGGSSGGGSFSFLFMIVLAMAMLFAGIQLEQQGLVSSIPVVGDLLGGAATSGDGANGANGSPGGEEL